MATFKKILVTTDLSETSALAFEPACELAAAFGAEMLVVHVVEDQLPAYMDEFTAVPIDTILNTQTRRATESLDQFLAAHLPEGARVESLVAHGIAHLEIPRIAEERGVDLIVMATHGRGFVSHALFGSTTERIVRKAPCPVLTIRERRTNA